MKGHIYIKYIEPLTRGNLCQGKVDKLICSDPHRARILKSPVWKKLPSCFITTKTSWTELKEEVHLGRPPCFSNSRNYSWDYHSDIQDKP